MTFSSKYDDYTNYRVDRMKSVLVAEELVSQGAIVEKSDIAKYTEQVFKQMIGDECSDGV